MIQSTDLEVSVRKAMAAGVEKEGEAAVPSRILTDIIKSLPEAAVTFEQKDEVNAEVRSGNSVFGVRLLNSQDFPAFPTVEKEKAVELPVSLLSDAVRQVGRSASRDETRPVFTGILLQIGGGEIKMVATDSYRLALRRIELDEPIEDLEVIIPSRTAEEISRIAGAHESVSLGVSQNQVIIEAGDAAFVSRRIEGQFPDYRKLIPAESETIVKVNREEFLEAAKRVAIFAQQNSPLRVKVDSDAQNLHLSAATPDLGGADEDLMVEAEGEAIEIAFNAAFLIDGLAAAQSETVRMELTTPLKQGVLRSEDAEDFTYIIMPVRLG